MYRFVATRLCAAVALAAVLAAPAAAASPATYTSTLLMEAAPVPGAYGLAFDADDVLYVGSAGLQVTAMDKETGEIIKVYGPAPEWGADDLAFGPDGSLYNTAILNGTVGKLAPDGSHTILNETPILGVNPVAVSDDGRLFVGIALMGDALYEFDPTGATEPRLINEGLGLNGFDWWDGYLWAPRMYTGELVRIDVDSGEVTTIADGFTYSTSADVGPDGMVYVNDNGAQQIVKVDPQTGSKTIVAPIGGDNMAISSTGRLFLSNGDNARVVENPARRDHPPGQQARAHHGWRRYRRGVGRRRCAGRLCPGHLRLLCDHGGYRGRGADRERPGVRGHDRRRIRDGCGDHVVVRWHAPGVGPGRR